MIATIADDTGLDVSPTLPSHQRVKRSLRRQVYLLVLTLAVVTVPNVYAFLTNIVYE